MSCSSGYKTACIFSNNLAKACKTTCHNYHFCVCVLWTHSLAKSLWGSLNRLCFPSGESIQVTDTKSRLYSKWPWKSWKSFLIWHLTISDVAVRGHAIDSSLSATICFLHLPPEWLSKSVTGLLWFYINIAKVRLQMTYASRKSWMRCSFLFGLIWVVQVVSADSLASVV